MIDLGEKDAIEAIKVISSKASGEENEVLRTSIPTPPKFKPKKFPYKPLTQEITEF